MRDSVRGSLRLIGALSLSPAWAQERTVNFYNWSNYMAPGVLEDFTKETGIKVVYDTFDANETLETRLLAGRSGYDVVVPTGYFLQRQITAKVFLKLDKSKLPNLAKFKDCGIHMLDSADDILPAALSYLGIDPNSTKPADLEKAAELVGKIRPSVRKFHSSEYLGALASGEICFVVGWSGDVMQARSRAAEAKAGVEIGYAIPKEGAQMFFDNLAIPADAKNVAEAYELINYLYRPEVAAKNSDFLSYANGNLASQKLINPKILNDRNIYPDEAMQKKLFVIQARDPATQRVINRLWTRVKTGK
jgi:spermidine/putrescine-binding protein